MSDDSGNSGNSFTEYSSTGWLGNIANSFVGALVGFGLLIGSFFFLNWNEGRAVEAINALDHGLKTTIEASSTSIDPAANGQLVHLTGDLSASTAPRDPVFGISTGDTVRLMRTVEMYQWEETTQSHTNHNMGGSSTTEKTYNYQQVWSASGHDSAHFHIPAGHENPHMPYGSQTFEGKNIHLDAYALDAGVLAQIDDFQTVDLADKPAPQGYQTISNEFYSGQNFSSPAVGDLKVGFKTVPAEIYSIVAAQTPKGLTTFNGDNGYHLVVAKPGTWNTAALIHVKKKQENNQTWLWRGVGYLMMIFGFRLIMAPLAALAYVLPFLGAIVNAGTFLIALALATPLTLITIALTWMAHRPVLGCGLIAAGLVAGGALIWYKKSSEEKSA